MGANRKTIERPRQGAVSRLGSAPAGAHKMGAANLVAPMLAHSPANPHPASHALPKNMAQPIKGVGGEVEDHSKASGLGEVFRPHTCPH